MNKRNDILSATRSILVKNGIQAISFPKIFRLAGVGAGTVYNYFKNKDDLLNTLYKETIEIFDQALLKDFDENLSLQERFFCIGINFIKFVIDHPDDLSVLMACNHSPAISEDLRKNSTKSMRKTIALLEEGMSENILIKMDSLIAYRLFSGALLSVAQGELENSYTLSEETTGKILSALWCSLLLNDSY